MPNEQNLIPAKKGEIRKKGEIIEKKGEVIVY